jgi:predicted nucleic acid-binding protein
MSLIVDASIATKWVANEPKSDEARALYLSDDCLAPSLILAEVGNALWKKHRQQLITVAQARAAISALPGHLQLFDIIPLAEHALEFALALRHPIYDCYYLALAERESAMLVTADERFIATAKKTKVKIRPL